jgi:hypothetical protein
MKLNKITENEVLPLLNKILLEESSKVNRNDYNRVMYKIDELEGQLIETIKEIRKLKDSIPDGLKTLSSGRIETISNNLTNSQSVLNILKNKVKQHKKNSYQQNVIEKK